VLTNKIKVTLFFTYGISLKTWAKSGLLQREIRLYKELHQNYGVQFQFITYGDSSDRQWEDKLCGIELLPIYEKIRKPSLKLFAILQSLWIPWRLRKELVQTDLLKTNQIWGGWVAVISKWLFKKPLLVRCGYEPYKNSLIDNNRTSKDVIRQQIFKWTSLFTYRWADHIWLTSSEISEFVIKKYNLSNVNITVRQNWIDTDKFTIYNKDEVYRDRVLYVGRLSAEKNVDLLLKSLQGTDLEIDIVGSGELQEKLALEAESLGVTVNFLGRVPNDDMVSIFNQYAVYVLCSRYEGNPKTLLEAMACGCAVVGTNVPGIRDVIYHEKSGVLVDESPNELRTQIVRLLADNELCLQLGKQARKQIIENNSLEVVVKKEYEIYQELVTY